MRKIDEAMVKAVNEKKNFISGNTEVRVSDGGNWVRVFLHGNLIYTSCEESGECLFTLAGWNTAVTRSRLHALGVDVCGRQCSGFGIADAEWPTYNGNVINPNKWYEVVK